MYVFPWFKLQMNYLFLEAWFLIIILPLLCDTKSSKYHKSINLYLFKFIFINIFFKILYFFFFKANYYPTKLYCVLLLFFSLVIKWRDFSYLSSLFPVLFFSICYTTAKLSTISHHSVIAPCNWNGKCFSETSKRETKWRKIILPVECF